MWFKDGFHFEVVSIKSIRTQNVLPTIDELVKFRKPGDDTDGDMAGLSTLLANRKKGNLMEGDAVVVVQGDLKDLRVWVKKVEEENVHITTKMEGLPETLAFNEKDICKYFKCGDYVKVVSGSQDGAAGMVVEVEGHILAIFSDTTKEHTRVFVDNVVKSYEVTSGNTKIWNYGLRDHIFLDNGLNSKSGTSTPSMLNSQRRLPRGGPPLDSRGRFRGRRGHDSLVGSTIKIRMGPLKGNRGRVVAVNGQFVRVELESQMNVVTVNRNIISDAVSVATLFCEPPWYGIGRETPMHPSQTPLHPSMTPWRDGGD